VVAVQLLAVMGTATLLALYAGWGLARLLLPTSLKPQQHLFAPLLGYALMLIIGYWHVRTISGLVPALITAALISTLLNGLAWHRTGPPQPLSTIRSEWPLLILLACTFLIGVLPIVAYGHPAIIGAGWDTENYLPVARYLERGPVSAIATASSNPLRDLNSAPPQIGLTLGFSIWQGYIDLLTQQEAFATFAPLLAWLRTLGVLAAYLCFRSLLSLERPAALLGAAFTSAGSLLLWISYFNFGMQLAAWPLIPLVVCLIVATLEAGSQNALHPRQVLPAALSLSAVPIAYYPALTLLAPLLAMALLPLLWQMRHSLGMFARSGMLMGISTLLLAAPTIADYAEGFAYRYANQPTTLGVYRFAPAAAIVGLTPFGLPAIAHPLPALVLPASAMVLLLITSNLLGLRHSLRLISLVAGGLLYLAWLRYWQNYPYAYLKGAAYVGWIVAACLAAGWQQVQQLRFRILQLIGSAASMLVLGSMLIAQGTLVNAHWQQPVLYRQQLPALLEVRSLIPAGSLVRLSSDARVEGLPSGLAAYLLDHTTVIGAVRTGYTSVADGTPNDYAEYALLAEYEDASVWGYTSPFWRGGGFALYKRPADRIAHERFEIALKVDEQLELAIGETLPDFRRNEATSAQLAVATLAPTELLINGQRYQVAAGGSLIELTPPPATVRLRNDGGAEILLQHITLSNAARSAQRPISIGASELPNHQPAITTIRAYTAADGNQITTELQAFLNHAGPIVATIDIWDGDRPYGWYGVVLSPDLEKQNINITLNLATGTAAARNMQGEIPLGASFAGLRPGNYIAYLKLGTNSLSLIEPAELFRFRIDNANNVQDIADRKPGR
jgi:hypothetical protein